jgi:hypothetical protein
MFLQLTETTTSTAPARASWNPSKSSPKSSSQSSFRSVTKAAIGRVYKLDIEAADFQRPIRALSGSPRSPAE